MRTFPLHLLTLTMMLFLSLMTFGQEKPDREPLRASFEAMNNEQIKLVDELCDVLQSVKDEKAIANAVKKINLLAKRQRDLEIRLSRLARPSKEDQEVILKKYREEMDASVDRLSNELTRLMNEPKLQKVLNATMRLMMNPPEPPAPNPESKPSGM